MSGPSAPGGRLASVVIPVLDAGAHLPGLLKALRAQRPAPPGEIVAVDSNSSDDTAAIARAAGVTVIPVDRFSHGGARNLGARAASGEVVVFLSQDAVPADEHWLAELLAPFADSSVAAAYSRQVPHPDANPMERFFLESRFPPGPAVRRERRGSEALTLERVFFSNVSSAVRRDTLLAHPFDDQLIMSEDQQLSRDLMQAGYAVMYQPSSVVLHSHNYTIPVVFRRYFDSVYSLRVIFPAHDMDTSVSMGLRYLAREAGHIIRHHPGAIPRYVLYTMAKTAGTLAGHYAERMPRSWARRMSLHRYHWSDPAA